MSTETVASTAATTPGTTLPLRQDEVVGAGLLLKVMLVTALLLGGAYVVLRLYVRLQRRSATGPVARPALHCDTALRLSARTRVYLVEAGHQRILVTESPTGSNALLLPADGGPSGTPAPLPAQVSATGEAP